MSFIDSSTATSGPSNGLTALASETSGDEPELDEVEEEQRPREIHGTLLENLIDQIPDVNLARRLPQDLLDRIGMQVVREYEIDDNSRKDWEDLAIASMRFTLQDADEKVFPWPQACYSLDTDILTSDGWKPIGDVAVGDRVLSRAPDGGADYAAVTRTFRHRASEVIHFEGKSIDLLVTPNHRMLVEDRDTGETSLVEAREFLRAKYALAGKAIPLTSHVRGETPDAIYSLPAAAYLRFLGWYVAEGWPYRGTRTYRQKRTGAVVQHGPYGSSIGIAQSRTANPEKYETLLRDIEACGFTYTAYPTLIVVHSRSMPPAMVAELRGLGGAHTKHLPSHVMKLDGSLLEHVLETLIAGDGSARAPRAHQTIGSRTYATTSHMLAGQVQEICQKIGVRGTISRTAACVGGEINGRSIIGVAETFIVSINAKSTCQVLKLKRQLESFDGDVACVEVAPHHTVYVRRNGKAVWCGNSNIIFPLLSQAATEFGARAYPAVIQGNKVVKGVVWGSDRGTPIEDDEGHPMLGPGIPPPSATAAPATPGAPPATPAQGSQTQWLIAPGEKRARAERVSEHMSYQLLVEMKEWEVQTDQLLHQLPIIGGAARKTFRNFAEDRSESLFVGLLDLVWNYRAPSFETAPRHTEKLLVYPHEITEYERAHLDHDEEGMWLHLVYGPGDASPDIRTGIREASGDDLGDESAPHLFLEQHRRLDLDDDGYPEPYVVTVHKRSSKVVRIVARYEQDGIKASDDGETILRIEPADHYSLIRFLPAIDGGSYPIGLGHLAKPLNEAINTTLNQMFDAGTLQNAGGGFIGEELGIASGQVLFQVGRYTRVKTRGSAIRDAVFPIPFQGASPVLFQLLGFLVEAAKQVVGVQNVLVGDAAIANAPPTTILALIEQGLGFYTAIIKRVFRGFTSEFDKLHRLNRKYLTEKTSFHIGDEEKEVSPDDYKFSGGVTTVADPRMTTDMQRLGRANLLNTFREDPLVNQREIRLRIFEAANIERIDDLMAPPDPNAAAVAQMAMAKAQAELGRERAAELKDQTQAFLNLAMARAKATAPEEAAINQQMDFLRLNIEALNARVRAAAVDHAFHDTGVRAQTAAADRAQRMTEAKLGAQGGGDAGAGGAPVEPTPAPTGAFPAAPGPGPAQVAAAKLPAPAAAGGSGGPGLPPLPNLETPGQGTP